MALLAWDAKIEMAGFRDPFADKRTPRYFYSDAMVMGDPLKWNMCDIVVLCREKQTTLVFVKFTWRLHFRQYLDRLFMEDWSASGD